MAVFLDGACEQTTGPQHGNAWVQVRTHQSAPRPCRPMRAPCATAARGDCCGLGLGTALPYLPRTLGFVETSTRSSCSEDEARASSRWWHRGSPLGAFGLQANALDVRRPGPFVLIALPETCERYRGHRRTRMRAPPSGSSGGQPPHVQHGGRRKMTGSTASRLRRWAARAGRS